MLQESDSRYGAHLTATGAEFRLPGLHSEGIDLILVDAELNQQAVPMSESSDGWSVCVPGVKAGQLYGYRISGEWKPAEGIRTNPAKLLIDPYARAVTGGVDFTGPVIDHIKGFPFTMDDRDSLPAVPLSVIINETPAPEPIARRRPMSELIIYEAHVKGFTKLNPQVPEHLRGTYAGLACPSVISYLKKIGVNAIELLPIYHFISEPEINRRGKKNYWGYSPLGFFAPHGPYCSAGTTGAQVDEFKAMVTALHQADIEVILDVVYNHTCEGGINGPCLAFRGMNNREFYRLTQDPAVYYDVTGCGNSINTSNSEIADFVLESMRYWVKEMGVDGFRFDLAPAMFRNSDHQIEQNDSLGHRITEDLVFADIKMIAEPWDLGPFGYQLGRFGSGWSEWNDRYRGFMRDYWRGVAGVQELATRVTGSADIFDSSDRPPSASINFITAHDGFTLRDLVSYNHKHNDDNGEENQDGSNDNRSYNYGFEGETADSEINALRHRQARNLMATLILSGGTPMIFAGDERGHTQQGNNNAYCQDNPLGWLDWNSSRQWVDLTDLTSKLTALRAHTDLLRPDTSLYRDELFDDNGRSLQRYSLAWMNGYSGEMRLHDWHDNERRLLGMYRSKSTQAILVWFYSGTYPIDIVMPSEPWGSNYTLLYSTAEPDELPPMSLAPDERLTLPGRTVAVMNVTVPSQADTAHSPRRDNRTTSD